MSPRPVPLQQHRHSIVSHDSSSSLGDDENAITPVTMDETSFSAETSSACEEVPSAAPSPPSRRGSVGSNGGDKLETPGAERPWLSLDVAADGAEHLDTEHLWRRMLALQRRFHCYNSARMSAALEDESVQATVPSRACLDLLNDSITKLPDEVRRRVAEFVQSDVKRGSKKRGAAAWRIRMKH